ncbi:MAG: prolipoprotein diacylglyceryl transferase [Chloroflexota bacterium]|nr:prolipoprotein diacylglyceryl transferase [Chloroflexota bacterium]
MFSSLGDAAQLWQEDWVARQRAASRKRGATRTLANRAQAAQSAKPAIAAISTEPEALVATYWFDPGEEDEPYAATIRLTGKRAGVSGTPRASDAFVHEEQVDRIVPGSGPMSISTRVYGLTPGTWSVTANLIRPRADSRGRRMTGAAHPEVLPLRTATWSWRRWTPLPGPATALVKTRWSLLARIALIPAVMPGTVFGFVALGAILALAVLAAHIGYHGLAVSDALVVTAAASLAGLIGAKLWYVRLHPKERVLATGWAVDGFVVVAPLAAIGVLVALKLPVGAYLDDVTPSLFLTVALGRLGCFFTGCCAGRLTASPWGVWCSDQRIGARRVPTQLLESAFGLGLGLVTLVLVVVVDVVGSGAIFVGGFVAYLLARQLLLRLRAEPRRYLWQRSRLVGRPA